MLQIGDKVRFLDSTGGGIVRSFKSKDMVMVEDEDGFEIPTLVSQCVVVNDDDDARASGHVKAKQAPPRQKSDAAMRGSMDHSDRLAAKSQPAVAAVRTPTWQDLKQRANANRPGGGEADVLNLDLAFVPVDSRQLSTSDFEVYLVNDSPLDVDYVVLSPAERGMLLRTRGTIEANTKERLFVVGRADLDDLERTTVQLLAYRSDRPYAPQRPLSVDLRINTTRFYKLHSFVANDYFDDDALIVSIVRNGKPFQPLVVDEQALAASIREKAAKPAQPKVSKPNAPIPLAQPIEVDLHADALLDTTAGMDNTAILQYQLSVFHKAMQAHANEHGRRLVFIHGKGEGVLRKAIVNELRRHYPACSWQDASFQQYGFGATQVTIHGGN